MSEMQPYTLFVITMCLNEDNEICQRKFLVRKDNVEALEVIRETCQRFIACDRWKKALEEIRKTAQGLQGYRVETLVEYLLLRFHLEDGTEDWGRVLNEEYDNDRCILIDEVLTFELLPNM